MRARERSIVRAVLSSCPSRTRFSIKLREARGQHNARPVAFASVRPCRSGCVDLRCRNGLAARSQGAGLCGRACGRSAFSLPPAGDAGSGDQTAGRIRPGSLARNAEGASEKPRQESRPDGAHAADWGNVVQGEKRKTSRAGRSVSCVDQPRGVRAGRAWLKRLFTRPAKLKPALRPAR